MIISHVAINQSDHRKNDFDIKGKKNTRHQIDLYILNEHYDSTDEYDEKYNVCVIHFTAYNCNNNVTVYNFFIQALTDLATYYEMECETSLHGDYSTNDFNECGINHKGFPSFIDKYYPIALYGQSKRSLFEDIEQAHYLFYSSLKLISYPFESGGVCNGVSAWQDIEDFNDFVNNPPKMIELPPNSIY